MLPLTKMTCPTDFSTASKYGVRVAMEFGRHFSAGVYLVHVVTPVPVVPGLRAPTGFHLPSVLLELQEIARTSLEKLLEEEAPTGVRVEPRILTGDPAMQIVRFSSEIEADLIVMSTHGQTGWRRFVAGSVTEKVVRQAGLPVLTIWGGAPPSGGKAPD